LGERGEAMPVRVGVVVATRLMMSTEPEVSFPLPEDPLLADAAAALRDGGHWGWVVDADWRSV